MNKWTDWRINGICLAIGASIFLGFYFALDQLLLGSIFAITSYIAALLIFPDQEKEIEFEMLDLSNIDEKKIDKIIKQGYKKLGAISKKAYRLNNPKLVNITLEIVTIGRNIFDNFRKDPDDINTASHFLPYYLNSAGKLLKKNIELEHLNYKSPDVDAMLKKIDQSLHLLRDSLKKQYDKLLQNDVLDLDTDIQVLEETLKMEDFS